jgi:hypothetical protein
MPAHQSASAGSVCAPRHLAQRSIAEMTTAFEHVFVAVKCRGKDGKGSFPLNVIDVAVAVSRALAALTLGAVSACLGVVFWEYELGTARGWYRGGTAAAAAETG